MYVCPHDKTKMAETTPDLPHGIPLRVSHQLIFRQEVKGHKVQKHYGIEGVRVAGMSLHLHGVPIL